jgi:hypothetical protein
MPDVWRKTGSHGIEERIGRLSFNPDEKQLGWEGYPL